MAKPTYITSHEAQISCTVAGVTFPAVASWSTFEGGDPVADTGQLLPGNVMPAVATPGPSKRSSLTVTRPISVEINNLRSTIDAAVNNTMSASYTPTDADGNVNGGTVTITGLMKQPQWPKWDGSTGNVPAFGLVMECDS